MRPDRAILSTGILALALFAGAAAGDEGREERYRASMEQLEARRVELGERYAAASSKSQRTAVREEAREVVIGAIVDEIIPAWKGKPWTMAAIDDGLRPDARDPFEDKGVSCSWFVVSVLENAGLRLSTARRFAGTIAVHLQHALSPGKGDIHRFWNTTPRELEGKLAALGDGLYVVGLNCHVGFIHVSGGEARFMHSSYVEPYRVVVEDLTTSPAIAYSQDAGYVVSPLFEDVRLIDHWLTGRPVQFEKLEGR